MIKLSTTSKPRVCCYGQSPQPRKGGGYGCSVEINHQSMVRKLATGEHVDFEVDGNRWTAYTFQTTISPKLCKIVMHMEAESIDWDKLPRRSRTWEDKRLEWSWDAGWRSVYTTMPKCNFKPETAAEKRRYKQAVKRARECMAEDERKAKRAARG